MKKLALLISALISLGLSAEEEQETTTPDYSDWYQVEVIVFAISDPQASDEVWIEQSAQYPADMLTLALADPDSLRPTSLAQLRTLMENERIMNGEVDIGNESGDEPGPLFDNRNPVTGEPLAEVEPLPVPEPVINDESPPMSEAGDSGEPVDLSEVLNPLFPRAFEIVPEEERFLTRVATSVNRSSRYRLLSYLAWRQPVTTTDDAFPILVQAGNRYDDRYEVDGTLAVSRSRYLHVDANLWFTQFTQKYEQDMPLPEIVSEFDPDTLREYPELVTVERNRGNYIPIHSHQMQLSRRMRSATLHFLDHPYFGVLVQIENFDYEPPEVEEGVEVVGDE